MSWMTASIAGETLPYLEFFRPTNQFDKSVSHLSEKEFFDVGCGVGLATKALRLARLYVTPIDICYREGSGLDVVIADGASFPYPPGSVVMMCRPCHGDFCMNVLEQAIRCGCSHFLYVGKEENVEVDLDDYVLSSSVKVDRFDRVGRDGEIMLAIDLNGMTVSW